MVNTNVQFRIVKSGESYNRVWIGSLPKNPNNTVLRQNFDRCDRLVGSTTSSSLTTAELSACVPLTVGRTVPNNNQTLDAGDYNLLISSVTAPPPPTTTTTNTSSSTDRKTRTNNKTTTSNVNFVPNTVNYATVADQNLVSNLLSRSQVPGQQTNINSPDPATNIVTKTQITTTVGITIRTNRFDTPSGNVLMNLKPYKL